MKKAIYDKNTRKLTYVEMEDWEITVQTPKERIKELKQMLEETDYKAIKYAEGHITEEDYAETKAQRQAWRDEINRLELEV